MRSLTNIVSSVSPSLMKTLTAPPKYLLTYAVKVLALWTPLRGIPSTDSKKESTSIMRDNRQRLTPLLNMRLNKSFNGLTAQAPSEERKDG